MFIFICVEFQLTICFIKKRVRVKWKQKEYGEEAQTFNCFHYLPAMGK